MKREFLTAMAASVFLSALACNVGATALFQEHFSSEGLSFTNWGNSQSGQTFSTSISTTGADSYTLSLDYFTTDLSSNNGGGFAGISGGGVNTPAYTDITYRPSTAIIGWQNVSYTFSLDSSWKNFSLMFEGAFVGNIKLADSYLSPLPEGDTMGRFDGSYTEVGWFADSNIASPVPEPASMLLFGAGLLGLAGMHRRIRNL